jgi:diketogulonate reductase-like aldo/keto reductase
LIDTAEMYGDGGAEEVVAAAIAGRRDSVYLVSKVLPQNASREGTLRAAEGSLRRLRTDWIDLYLLHWEGNHPLEETYAAFERLVEQGKIRRYGLSNFDLPELARSETLRGGAGVVANQILYNLTRRGVEPGLLPWCAEHGMLVMAYSPLEQGRLGSQQALDALARRHGCTPQQIALAWTIRNDGVMAIPKAAGADHVRQNAAAADLTLTREDLDALDAAFPRPRRACLEML